MAMKYNREAIIDRIKKLKNHAESAKSLGSLEEAESFMLKVTELLMEYNISEHEVNSHQTEEKDRFKNWAYAEWISFDDKHQGWQWKKQLMKVICKYNFTDYIFNSRSKRLQVYGNMENVDVTVWLYHYLEIGLYNLAEKHYQQELAKKIRDERRRFTKVEAYTFKRDFLLGAVQGFDDQLYEQRKQQGSKTSEIILYNSKALDEYLHKTNPRIKMVQSKELPIAGMSFHAGYEAGKSFKVNKPLSGSSQKKLL